MIRVYLLNLLITGGAGFIGSNYISYLLNQNKNIRIINLDKLTYASRLENLREIENHPRYIFIHGDICDRKLIRELFNNYNIGSVIHFAAESHVDNSIAEPEVFIQTNIAGTFNLLEEAREYWMNGVNEYKKGFENARFHHVSTDEVYGSLGREGYFTEETPYAPNSPYSASKASSDMIVRSYFQTYGLNIVITNCSNNFGPNQHEEKLIPKVVERALTLKEIPIYGDGMNIRDWLYVTDHCRAIEVVFNKGRSGETYLIGGHNEKTNLEIVNEVCDILDELHPAETDSGITSYKELIRLSNDRPGHDFRYAIDDRKVREELKFEAAADFKQSLRKTIESLIIRKHREKDEK